MSVITGVLMPEWGVIMTEGKIIDWLVREGDHVVPDTDLVEIETTKVTNVLQAGVEGRVRRLVAEPGAILPIGALLAVVTSEDASNADVDAYIEANAYHAPDSDAEAGHPQIQAIEAAGRKVSYLAAGLGSSNPPVALLHGFGGDLTNWQFNQAALAIDRPVFALDLPGHGDSSLDVGEGDLSFLAGSVLAWLDAMQLRNTHLIGHSLGGAVAMRLAEMAPDRVRSLGLIAPAGLEAEIGAHYIPAFVAAEKQRQVKEILGRLFADPDLVSGEMVNAVLHYKRRDGVQEALGRIAGAVFPDGRQAVDLRPTLGRLSMPVLIIRGSADRLISDASLAALPAWVNVEVLAGAGHMPQLEQAAAVNRTLAQHIAVADA